jgi:hypothetical protein
MTLGGGSTTNISSILQCVLPCSWTVIVLIVAAMFLGKFKGKVYHDILPTDYHNYDQAGKKKYWNVSHLRAKDKSKVYTTALIVWLVGGVLMYVVVLAKPAVAKLMISPTPTLTNTATATNTPTRTPTPVHSPTSSPTATGLTTATFTPTQTPRTVYVNHDVVQTVIVERIVPVVITQVVTLTAGPTQTPWVVTVVVTATFTPTPTGTASETPTASSTP